LQKKFYESYIIIDGNLDDSAVEDEIKKFETFLSKNDIDIAAVNRIGRRRLAYPIRKRANGYYVCFEINCSPELVPKLERVYKLDETILRYLTIFVSGKTRKEKDEHFRNKAIAQSKLDEMREKQNSSVPENAVAESDKKESITEPVQSN